MAGKETWLDALVLVVGWWGWPQTIALLGVLIAAFQWRTAREKLLLDLFDKRYAVYTDILHSVRTVDFFRGSDFTPNFRKVVDARIRSAFLFGQEVTDCVKEIEDLAFEIKNFLDIREGRIPFDNADELIRDRAPRISNIGMDLLNKSSELGEKMAPYMKVHVRRRWHPFW
ncbi:hypothetical protein [Pelagibacterium mangrovi]|uniref:hypothetical protein n=1 Tax=Pelagibacterium mangrovi TaxID=3119828 RepID=UPI002FC76AC5